jgi:hypothetical protein
VLLDGVQRPHALALLLSISRGSVVSLPATIVDGAYV